MSSTTSTITVNVELDKDKVPESITWSAGGSTAADEQRARAMMMAFWDAQEKTALRIDLWTKEMMVDEMTDFFYQVMITMADTYSRSTHQPELAEDIKKFARDFYEKFRAKQVPVNL